MDIQREEVLRDRDLSVDQQRNVDKTVLAEISPFKALGPQQLESVVETAVAASFRRGEIIAGPERAASYVIAIARGLAGLFREVQGGEECMVTLLGRGQVSGLVFLGSRVESTSTLRALANGTITYMVPKTVLEGVARRCPEMILQAHEIVSQRLVEAQDWMVSLSFERLRTRLERLLRQVAAANEDRLVPLTHEEIAASVGASRESVTRELNNMRRAGVVSFVPHHRDHRIVVLDPIRLS